MSEKINHPAHYQSNTGLEAIDVAEAFLSPEELRGAMKFNALKYLLRAGKKPGEPPAQDCGKGIWYTDRLALYFGRIHPDDAAVDRFAAAMKAKLAKKRDEGMGGWDDKAGMTENDLQALLIQLLEKGDPVDVGNLAMMLFNRDEKTAALVIREAK